MSSHNNLQPNRDNDNEHDWKGKSPGAIVKDDQEEGLTGISPPHFHESLGSTYDVYIEHDKPSTTFSAAVDSKTVSNMDAFDIRMKFNGLLTHLNASVTSANKAAQFALKHKAQGEDLHNVILESLEQGTMNVRANIMYFVEHLCDNAAREKQMAYVRMVERDIIRIVDAVVPEDGSGAANIKVVRKVIFGLGEKSYISALTAQELDEILKSREPLPDHDEGSTNGDTTMEGYTPQKTPSKSGYQQKVDKRQAEQRIEEDRERHKRSRENIWAVQNDGLPGLRSAQEVADRDQEFEKLWEETSSLGSDDEALYAEEAEERKRAADDWRESIAQGSVPQQ